MAATPQHQNMAVCCEKNRRKRSASIATRRDHDCSAMRQREERCIGRRVRRRKWQAREKLGGGGEKPGVHGGVVPYPTICAQNVGLPAKLGWLAPQSRVAGERGRRRNEPQPHVTARATALRLLSLRLSPVQLAVPFSLEPSTAIRVCPLKENHATEYWY